MSKLTDYRLLSFDVYGTLIGYETGVLHGLASMSNKTSLTRTEVLDLYHEHEIAQQTKTPDLPYSQLAATVHAQFAARLNRAALKRSGICSIRSIRGQMACLP